MSDKADKLITVFGDACQKYGACDATESGFALAAERANEAEDALRAYIAELEARPTPVKFSERKPPLVGRYLYFHKQYRRWYEEMWPYDPNKFTHWLPEPPAPDENA